MSDRVDRGWLAQVSHGDVIVMWIADHCESSVLETCGDEWEWVEFAMPDGPTLQWNDDNYWVDGTDEPALYMIAAIERERDAARAEVERLCALCAAREQECERLRAAVVEATIGGAAIGVRAKNNEVQQLRALLREWRETPFFHDHDDWYEWMTEFGARVDAVLGAKEGER